MDGDDHETKIAVPEDIRAKLKVGERYTWQVKAYSQKGTLLAISRASQFTIAEPK